MTSSSKSPASDDGMNYSSSNDDEESNARREADLRERDDFAKRLRQRDDDQTRKKFKTESVSHDSGRSKLSVEELRKKSRRVYLAIRKDKKVQEFEDELRDEEYLFRDVKLSKREEEDIKLKRIALNLAREHEKTPKLENIDRLRKTNSSFNY